MTALDPLIIPADVELRPVTHFPPELRARFADAADDDVIISRRASRITSRVVDQQSAALLQHFRSPTTLADAVFHYASAEQMDPQAVLEPAYFLVKRLLSEGLLAEEGSNRATALQSLLEVGDDLNGWVIDRTMQVLEDSEVHRVVGRDGRLAVLKVERAANAGRIEHEARVLRRLPPGCGPTLYNTIEVDEHPAMMSEWIDGVSILQGFARLHDLGLDGRPAVAELLVKLFERYAELHDAGILHGDVHPGNVLYDERGSVRLVDFGAAGLPGEPPPTRVGATEYLDPEWAQCQREGQMSKATPLSEQYSLAALAYRAITGSPTHMLSFEGEVMLQQIIHEAPRQFEEHNIVGWSQLERTLQRALEKDPTDRFPSVRALAHATAEACRVDLANVDTSARGRALDLEDRFVRFCEEHAARGLSGAMSPAASAAHGAASLSLTLLRLAELRGDPKLLSLSELWSLRSASDAQSPDGLLCDELDLNPETLRPTSIHHGLAGILMTRVRVAHRGGDTTTFWACVSQLTELSACRHDSTDLVMADPGVLLAATEAYRLIGDDHNGHIRDRLVASVDMLADDLWTRRPRERLGSKSGGLIGMAHGEAGFLYSQLVWRTAVGSGLPDGLIERLRNLAALAETGPHGLVWPIADHEAHQTMSGWCNGSAGLLYLWTVATEALGAEWMSMRDGAARSTAFDGIGLGNLCCGLAGRVYALLRVYRSTGDLRWLEHARRLAREALVAPQLQAPAYRRLELHERSLLKGLPGVLLAFHDADNPETSSMPLFAE